MRRFVLYLLTCLSLLQAPSALAEEPCPEFNNNIYMKWVDLDASCISISDFAKKIEAEGIWEIDPFVEEDLVVNLKRYDRPEESVEILFGGLMTKGAAILDLEITDYCEKILNNFESIGYPKFPNSYYEAGKEWHMYMPAKVGNTLFTLFPSDEDDMCLEVTLLTM